MRLIAYVSFAWVVFWVLHWSVSIVTYIFTGVAFNPMGLDQGRWAASGLFSIPVLSIGICAMQTPSKNKERRVKG